MYFKLLSFYEYIKRAGSETNAHDFVRDEKCACVVRVCVCVYMCENTWYVVKSSCSPFVFSYLLYFRARVCVTERAW